MKKKISNIFNNIITKGGLAILLTSCATTSTISSTNLEPIVDNRVIYSPKAINSFLYIYHGQTREIPLCMEALRVDSNYVVYDVKIPLIVHSDSTSSQFLRLSCESPYYVGIAHNHPIGNCQASQVDLERFYSDERARIESIICQTSIERDEVRIMTLNKDLNKND